MHEGILPSHLIFFLRHMSHAYSLCQRWSGAIRGCRHVAYSRNAPPLRIPAVAVLVHVVGSEHVARRHVRGVEAAAAEDAWWWRVHHGRTGGIEAVLGGVHPAGRVVAVAVVVLVLVLVVAVVVVVVVVTEDGSLSGYAEGPSVLCKGETRPSI